MEKLLSIINDDSIDHISISSDAFGSMPKFDKDGNLKSINNNSPTITCVIKQNIQK